MIDVEPEKSSTMVPQTRVTGKKNKEDASVTSKSNSPATKIRKRRSRVLVKSNQADLEPRQGKRRRMTKRRKEW